MRRGTAWKKKSIGVGLWGERLLKKSVKKVFEPKLANEESWLPEILIYIPHLSFWGKAALRGVAWVQMHNRFQRAPDGALTSLPPLYEMHYPDAHSLPSSDTKILRFKNTNIITHKYSLKIKLPKLLSTIGLLKTLRCFCRSFSFLGYILLGMYKQITVF